MAVVQDNEKSVSVLIVVAVSLLVMGILFLVMVPVFPPYITLAMGNKYCSLAAAKTIASNYYSTVSGEKLIVYNITIKEYYDREGNISMKPVLIMYYPEPKQMGLATVYPEGAGELIMYDNTSQTYRDYMGNLSECKALTSDAWGNAWKIAYGRDLGPKLMYIVTVVAVADLVFMLSAILILITNAKATKKTRNTHG